MPERNENIVTAAAPSAQISPKDSPGRNIYDIQAKIILPIASKKGNPSMSGFDSDLDLVVFISLFCQNPSYEIRIIFKENNILEFGHFLNFPDFENLSYQKNSVITKLKDNMVKMVLEVIHYSKFMYNNKDNAIVDNPTQRDYKKFKA